MRPSAFAFLAATVRIDARGDATVLRRGHPLRRRSDAAGSGRAHRARATHEARLPADPRVPEAMHLAVRLTRHGCQDANNSAASRSAFRALHARLPDSEWTRRTRVHY